MTDTVILVSSVWLTHGNWLGAPVGCEPIQSNGKIVAFHTSLPVARVAHLQNVDWYLHSNSRGLSLR